MVEVATRYYAVLLVKKGVRCAVSIEYARPTDPDTGERLDRAPRWIATLHGEPIETYKVAVYFDDYKPELGCTIKGAVIDKAEHDFIVKLRNHAIEHEPDMPEAAPKTKIDLHKMPSLF